MATTLADLFNRAETRFRAGNYDADTLRRLAAGQPNPTSHRAAGTTTEAHLPEDVVHRARAELQARRQANLIRAQVRAGHQIDETGPAIGDATRQRIAGGVSLGHGLRWAGGMQDINPQSLAAALDYYKQRLRPKIGGVSAGSYDL